MTLKDWNNGDVFYGADMDSLVLNSNMRFASAAERSATMVGDLAPFAGAASYLADVGTFTRYNGSAWIPLSGTAMFSWTCAAFNIAASTLYSINNYTTNLLGTYNYGGWFTPASGQFKPSVAGYYEFVGHIAWGPNGAVGARTVGLRLNGGAAFQPASCTGYTTNTDMIGTYYMRPNVQYLNGTTDYVELAVYHTNSANLFYSGSSYKMFFSGKLAGV